LRINSFAAENKVAAMFAGLLPVKKYRESVCYYKTRDAYIGYRAIRDMKNGANRYRVLEDSDEEGTYDKVQNVRFNNERE